MASNCPSSPSPAKVYKIGGPLFVAGVSLFSGIVLVGLCCFLFGTHHLRRLRSKFRQREVELEKLRVHGWDRDAFTEQLVRRDIRLVKVGYLRDLHKAGSAIPCRSAIDPKDLIAGSPDDWVTLYVIVWAWRSHDHPDPDGHHLEAMVKLFDATHEDGGPPEANDDDLVYMDWTGLPPIEAPPGSNGSASYVSGAFMSAASSVVTAAAAVERVIVTAAASASTVLTANSPSADAPAEAAAGSGGGGVDDSGGGGGGGDGAGGGGAGFGGGDGGLGTPPPWLAPPKPYVQQLSSGSMGSMIAHGLEREYERDWAPFMYTTPRARSIMLTDVPEGAVPFQARRSQMVKLHCCAFCQRLLNMGSVLELILGSIDRMHGRQNSRRRSQHRRPSPPFTPLSFAPSPKRPASGVAVSTVAGVGSPSRYTRQRRDVPATCAMEVPLPMLATGGSDEYLSSSRRGLLARVAKKWSHLRRTADASFSTAPRASGVVSDEEKYEKEQEVRGRKGRARAARRCAVDARSPTLARRRAVDARSPTLAARSPLADARRRSPLADAGTGASYAHLAACRRRVRPTSPRGPLGLHALLPPRLDRMAQGVVRALPRCQGWALPAPAGLARRVLHCGRTALVRTYLRRQPWLGEVSGATWRGVGLFSPMRSATCPSLGPALAALPPSIPALPRRLHPRPLRLCRTRT